MSEVLPFLVSWQTWVSVVLMFGIAPGLMLRLISLAFHPSDPRRKELLGELPHVPYLERPLWVAQQLEVAVCEGLRDRIEWAATGRVIHRWHLLDGVKQNAEFPDSFDVPSEDDKAQLEPGDLVKAGFTMSGWGERMWLEVRQVKRRHLVCVLRSHPFAIPRLSCDAVVKVKRREIIDIVWRDEEPEPEPEVPIECQPWHDLPRSCACASCVEK